MDQDDLAVAPAHGHRGGRPAAYPVGDQTTGRMLGFLLQFSERDAFALADQSDAFRAGSRPLLQPVVEFQMPFRLFPGYRCPDIVAIRVLRGRPLRNGASELPERHRNAPPEESLYEPIDWHPAGEFSDILYEKADGIAKITINRPEVRNAFRPQTLAELKDAFNRARDDLEVGSIIFTGAGTEAFCSGGDQRIRGDDGYIGDDDVAEQGVGRLDVGDLHVQIRRLPKPVVAMVAGYAVGGGHILHLVCDMTIAGDNARFGQTGPRVGSFDGGFGASLLARNIGVKKAKEFWFLCRHYTAEEALDMGLVNAVIPVDQLERETVAWCREMGHLSPLSLRLLKSSFNAEEDGLTGLQQLSHDATLLFYMSEEGQEGRNAFREGRKPDFDRFPKRP